jgi:hypothetical protein
MLQPSPLKEISSRNLEQWGDTKEVIIVGEGTLDT